MPLYYDIHSRRIELGLTLEEVGNRVGVSKGTVKKWESGMIDNMKRDKIALLAKVLEISPLDLIGVASGETYTQPLTKDEQTLLDNYRCLNEEGQEKLSEYAQDLVDLGKYKKDTPDKVSAKEA